MHVFTELKQKRAKTVDGKIKTLWQSKNDNTNSVLKYLSTIQYLN